MNTTELKNRFLIQLDAVASGAAPGFTDDEISELLTKSQDDLIQQFIQLGRWEELYTLLNTVKSTAAIGIYGANSYRADIPVDFKYYCTSRVKVGRSDGSGITNTFVTCDLISPTIMDRFLVTAFNKAFYKYPVVFLNQTDDSLTILVDTYTTFAAVAENVEMTYIFKPPLINITTSTTSYLPDKLHKDIVSLAVDEAVKSLKIAKITTQ